MFWDGERWLPDDGRPHAHPQPHAGRRVRDWLSTGIMVLVVACLVVPFAGALAARPSARTQLAQWSETSKVAVYQEGSRQISYRGGWVTAYYPDYLGGKARATDSADARVSLKFRGAAVSWVGPIGPTRGRARVYIDGVQVATVSTWNESFRPTRVLFQKSWDEVAAHRISVVAVGTPGHPTVALDAFIVRLDTGSQDAPVDDAGAPIATQPPEEPAPSGDASVSSPEPTASPSDTPSVAPTDAPAPPPSEPAPAPTPAPTVTPAPTPAPTPTPAPVTTSSVRVTSIPALLTALADNTVTDIVVANGTYPVSPAGLGRSDSLWIGSRFAGRTRAVTVRAETRGGVTFDGGGATAFGGLTFTEGSHDQTWDGFRFANGQATDTGVIVFGGYAGRAAPHHITLRAITILKSVTGHNDKNDHAIYFSHAVGGPHDILIDGLTVDASGSSPLSTALHFYHHDSTNVNVWNTVVRNLVVNGTYIAISMWDSTLHDVTIDGATITNAIYGAMQYEQPGTRITLANMTSTGSGQFGFYSSLGSSPPGVTFINDSFR